MLTCDFSDTWFQDSNNQQPKKGPTLWTETQQCTHCENQIFYLPLSVWTYHTSNIPTIRDSKIPLSASQFRGLYKNKSKKYRPENYSLFWCYCQLSREILWARRPPKGGFNLLQSFALCLRDEEYGEDDVDEAHGGKEPEGPSACQRILQKTHLVSWLSSSHAPQNFLASTELDLSDPCDDSPSCPGRSWWWGKPCSNWSGRTQRWQIPSLWRGRSQTWSAMGSDPNPEQNLHVQIQ